MYSILVTIAVGGIALFLGARFFGRRKAESSQMNQERGGYLNQLKSTSPQRAQRNDGDLVPYNWGRFSAALPDPNVSAPAWRLKQWHYHSINNGRWFMGMAIVNLGYVANAWVYLIDREQPKSSCSEYRALIPLGIGISFTGSSTDGTTCWRNRGNKMMIQAVDGRYTIDLHVKVDGVVLEGCCNISAPQQTLALLYPLEGVHSNRAAYTHKAAGMAVEGNFTWGDEELRFAKDDSFATMDWTRSYAMRETVWKWASFAGLASTQEGGAAVPVGLNLSAEVYDDKENAFWLNGKVYLVGPVTFTLPSPRRLAQDKWTILSHNGALQLEFTPHAARNEHLHLGIIASKFSQVGGTFSGTVDVSVLKGDTPTNDMITVENILGVVETHYALW